MKIVCRYNDPSNLPKEFPNDFDYGLQLEKEYLVMGVVIYTTSSTPYYLIDEASRPNWFPYQLFELIDNTIPCDWCMRINGVQENSDIHTIFGFQELCNDIDYYDQLIDRDTEAMQVYFRHKIELENSLL